jgi:hypothetical protein
MINSGARKRARTILVVLILVLYSMLYPAMNLDQSKSPTATSVNAQLAQALFCNSLTLPMELMARYQERIIIVYHCWIAHIASCFSFYRISRIAECTTTSSSAPATLQRSIKETNTARAVGDMDRKYVGSSKWMEILF